MKFVRGVAGVIGGFLFTFLMVQAAEMFVHRMYPPPPGADMKNMESVKAFVSTLPVTALLLVLAGWLVGTLAGTSIAARIGRSAIPAYVLGALLLAAGVANAMMIPQPLWFTIASFVIYISMTLLGAALGTINRDAAAAPEAA